MRTRRALWLTAATWLTTSVAQAQTFPRDDQWRVLECDGLPSFDGLGDQPGAIDERDIVGDAGSPALHWFADDDYLYLRMRVDADPLDAMQLRASVWAAELDTNFFRETYELFSAVDGTVDPAEVVLARNTTQRPAGDPADPPETTIATHSFDTHARTVEATGALTSSFGGDPDFFVDWAIDRDELADEGLLSVVPFALLMGTSSDTSGIDADIACHDGAGGGGAVLVEIFTDPVRPDGVVVVDTDGDGYADAVEIDAGTDPNDPDSFPTAPPGRDGGTTPPPPPPPGVDSGLRLRGGGGPAGGCSAARSMGWAASEPALTSGLAALVVWAITKRRLRARRRPGQGR